MKFLFWKLIEVLFWLFAIFIPGAGAAEGNGPMLRRLSYILCCWVLMGCSHQMTPVRSATKSSTTRLSTTTAASPSSQPFRLLWATEFLKAVAMKGKTKDEVVASYGPPQEVKQNGVCYMYPINTFTITMGFFTKDRRDYPVEHDTVQFVRISWPISVQGPTTARAAWQQLCDASTAPSSCVTDDDRIRWIYSGNMAQYHPTVRTQLRGTMKPGITLDVFGECDPPLFKLQHTFDTKTSQYDNNTLVLNPGADWGAMKVSAIQAQSDDGIKLEHAHELTTVNLPDKGKPEEWGE